jgi:DNA adenine methylase
MKLKPLLKWAGGKTKIAPKFEPFYDRSKRYVSLFGGGLGDVLAIDPHRALINDCWLPVINLYQQIKNGEQLALDFDFNGRNYEDYYSLRDKFNLLRDDRTPEAATYAYFVIKSCFNGVIRTNNAGEFNTPMGWPSNGAAVKFVENFSEYQKKFQNWDFTCLDFEKVSIESEDFIYADPPYDPVVPSFKYSSNFTWDDRVRLAKFLAAKKNPIVVSDHATDRVLDLYSDLGFTIQTFSIGRTISCKSEARSRPIIEMLAIKNIS